VTGTSELQVVLVDDHLALRKGIELLLRAEGMHVIGVTDSVDEGERMILERRPDVAIVDIGLGDGSGLELASRVLEECPEIGILLYTGSVDQERLRQGLDSGARGFALKAGSPTELVAAIKAVAEGSEYMDPRLARLLDNRERTAIDLLSPREREVVDLLADGLNADGIAERLFLSPQTVQTHVRNLMRKLGARTRVHAVALALRHRPIEHR
jgi:DNA-binding NarL/FixJ family response regulator